MVFKMKKICYLLGATGRDKLFYILSKEFKEFENIFLSVNKDNTNYLNEKNASFEEILEFYPNKPNYNLNKILGYEEKYNFKVWDLWAITFPRFNQWKIKKEFIYSYFQYTIEKIEKFFEKEKPNYLILYGAAGYQSLIIYIMAKYYGIKIIEIVHARIRNRFTITDSLDGKWPLLEKKLKETENKFNEENKKKAEEFIYNFCNKPKKAQSEDKHKENIIKKINRIAKWAFKHLKNRTIPPETKLLKWKWRYFWISKSSLFKQPIKNQKYIFYPLHFQPEVSTLWYGKWYVNQINLIELLAKSIPADHLLYVKEHSGHKGSKPKQFYKEIDKIPNVRLIHPNSNTFELIKNSSLIATITGTVGFEALIYKKPVITFGNVYYNACKEVINIKDPTKIPEIIKASINRKLNEKNINKFIYSLLESSYDGLVLCPGDVKDKNLNTKNIKLISMGIKEYINKELN